MLRIILLSAILLFGSCDAMLILSYEVKNNTREPLLLRIDKNRMGRVYTGTTRIGDSLLILNPGERVQVGRRSGMGFPWETRKLYRMQRSSTNFKLVRNDSVLLLNTEDTRWTYSRRRSTFTIRERDIQEY